MKKNTYELDKIEDKNVKKRLAVIQLAKSLGNVSLACKKQGMDRTSFYEWKKRYEEKGIEGLRDLMPVHRFHPQTTSPKLIKKILDTALSHPEWGCIKISNSMKEAGSYVSSPTIQKILIKEGLGTISQRVSRLEEKVLKEKLKVNSSQIKAISKVNPAFQERENKTRKPGELIALDYFSIGKLKGKKKLFVFVTVDSFGLYALTKVSEEKGNQVLVSFLQSKVFPFYKSQKAKIQQISIPNAKSFKSAKVPDLESLLKENSIKLIRSPKNGYMEKFKLILAESFLKGSKTKRNFSSKENLEKELSAWIKEYNGEIPQPGFPNMGATSLEYWKKS